MNFIRKSLSNSDAPRELRGNFIHLYFDIAWFGLLSGSAINFLNVYAARLGATGTQIGLLGATGAIMTLILAIPAGGWLEKQHTGRAVFWTSVFYRAGYLAWIFLPWLFRGQMEVWALIAINLLMGIPLTFLGVGFTAFFAEAVPAEWRAHVTGVRNVVLSIMFMISSLGSGYILDHVGFPQGYQLIFLIGFIGAAMSSLHLYFIKPVSELLPQPDQPALKPVSRTPRPGAREDWRAAIRLDIWQTDFRKILLVFLFFHLAQYLAIPIFPLYMVNIIRLNDNQIGVGSALFYLAVLLGSTQLARIVRRFNHKKVTGLGAAGMCVYPILMSISTSAWHYFGLSILGGFSWALMGGAYLNYILEHIPENDRPSYLAWYNVVANASILVGSLAGPVIADWTGLAGALVLFGILRGLSGLAILRFG